MKRLTIILSVLAIVLLTGCNGQSQADYTNTEDYELPNVTRLVKQCSGAGYYYLIDNNTGVVYLEYDGGSTERAITVMFNADGTLMKEKDIKK